MGLCSCPIGCLAWDVPELEPIGCWVGLMAASGWAHSNEWKLPRTAAASLCSCSHSASPLETFQYYDVDPDQSLTGSLLFSTGYWCTWDFVCTLQKGSLCFFKSLGISAIKPCWSSKPDSLGALTPVVGCPGWEAWLWLRIFTPAGELLWYNCFPVCGLPTWWVWDLT